MALVAYLQMVHDPSMQLHWIMPDFSSDLRLVKPCIHPLNDSILPPILQPYDVRIYPRCLGRTLQHLQYVSTWTGLMIECLNSPYGLTGSAFTSLVCESIPCDCCLCVFSIDGYTAHIVAGRCGNRRGPPVGMCSLHLSFHMTYLAGNTGTPSLSRMRLCQRDQVFLTQKITGRNRSAVVTPVKAAFLEWNSRLGVPLDVWAVISTGYVRCPICYMCRTTIYSVVEHRADGICGSSPS